MRETEVTVQVFDSLENINSSLLQKGFKMIKKYSLNDWYFIRLNEEETRKLSYEKLIEWSIIVREVMRNDVQNLVCYKKKYFDDNLNVISEDKLSIDVDSSEKIREIFKLAKLYEWCSLQNSSYVYQKGDIEFIVQDIKDLGIFIEHEEYIDIKNLNEKDKFDKLTNNLKELLLPLGDDYSCKKIYMKYKQK